MNMTSTFRKARCRSSYEKRGDKGKLESLIAREELRKSRTNMPRNIDNAPLSEYSKEFFIDSDPRSREYIPPQLILRNDQTRIEVPLNHPTYLLGPMPFKVDSKLMHKLRLFGFKAPQEHIETHPNEFKDFLKIESVKIKSTAGPHNLKSYVDKIIPVQIKNHRTNNYRKGNTHNDISFDRQSPYLDPRTEIERDEKEKEAIKKALYGANANNSLYQISGCTIVGSREKFKEKKPQAYVIGQQRSSPLRIGARDTSSIMQANMENNKETIVYDDESHEGFPGSKNTESDQSLSPERKRISLKAPSYVGQRFGPLEKIEEVSKKKSAMQIPNMQIPNIAIVGNTIQAKHGLFDAGREPSFQEVNSKLLKGSSYSPSKLLKQAELESADAAVSAQYILKNAQGSSRGDPNVAKTIQQQQQVHLAKLKKAATQTESSKSIDAYDTFGFDKKSAPTTPTPYATIDANNVVNNQSTAASSMGTSTNTQISNSPNTTNALQVPQATNSNIVGVTGTRFVPAKSPPKPTNSVQKLPYQVKGGRSHSVVNNGKARASGNNNNNSVFFHGNNSSSTHKVIITHNKQMPSITKNEEVVVKKRVAPPQPIIFKYFVGRGNNSALVRRVLKSRGWWEETPIYDHSFNLKWQQTSRGFKFEKLVGNPNLKQLVNHFEFHGEITTKNGLIRSLSGYCEANKVNLCDITPTTFVFNMDDEVNFDTDMQRFARFFIQHNPDQSVYPHPDPNDKKNADVWFNFDYRRKGKHHAPNLSIEKFNSPYTKPILQKTFCKGSTLWVLKPTGLNRGRGIEVFNSLEGLNEMMNQYFSRVPVLRQKKKEDEGSGTEDEEDEEEDETMKRGQIIKSRTFVVQKYIEHLFVVNNRKFDIRVWALTTQDMQLYFFREGYLRTCSEEYTTDDQNIFNKFVHLTNNAIQRHGENYGNHESGNQLSFKDLEKYIKEQGLDMDFKGKIYPRMTELVTISMQSAKRTMNSNDRKYSFEVFGYDFMIDLDYNVWLIEINTNPCLDESSPLLKQLLPRMLDDAFKLTVDVMFPKPEQPKETVATSPSPKGKGRKVSEDVSDSYSSIDSIEEPPKEKPKANFHVDGYDDNENMWQYLGSLQYEKPSPKKDAHKEK